MPQQTGDRLVQTSLLIAVCFVAIGGVIGSVVSPPSMVQIFGFCTLICVTLLGLLQNSLAAEKVEKVAAKAEELKQTMEEANSATTAKLEQIAKVGEIIHDLTNSGALAQKETLMITAEAKAEITHGVTDIEAAKRARGDFEQHKLQQEQVTATRNLPSQLTGHEKK